MARGGHRAGAQRPEKTAEYDGKKMTIKEVMAATGFSYSKTYRLYFSGKLQQKTKKGEIPQDIQDDAKAANKDPLEYMLGVMNDTEIESGRRDRMAMAAAPFVHMRACDLRPSKGDRLKDAAKKAGAGKFASPSPPKLVSISK